MTVTLSSSVESYRRDIEFIDAYYGPLIPDPDQLYDEHLAQEDRAADHTPASSLPAWMTLAGASEGSPSGFAPAPPTCRPGGEPAVFTIVRAGVPVSPPVAPARTP